MKVAFPADYGVDRLKGKDAEFEVKVKEVRAPKTAEADDEFAKYSSICFATSEAAASLSGITHIEFQP